MEDAGPEDAIRLDVRRAFDHLGLDRVGFHDEAVLPGQRHDLTAEDFIAGVGDVVLARRGMGTSYHLSVVVDDAGLAHFYPDLYGHDATLRRAIGISISPPLVADDVAPAATKHPSADRCALGDE